MNSLIEKNVFVRLVMVWNNIREKFWPLYFWGGNFQVLFEGLGT